ncbi:DJ-1/PfpI family protein [Streptomyces sp. NPDC054871]
MWGRQFRATDRHLSGWDDVSPVRQRRVTAVPEARVTAIPETAVPETTARACPSAIVHGRWRRGDGRRCLSAGGGAGAVRRHSGRRVRYGWPGATVRFVAAEPGLVQDVLGSLPVHVPTRYSEVERCDVLLIPGGGSFLTMVDDPAFLDWVRRMHAGTRFTTSVCTGSLVLGAAGLLEGLTATTHWDAAGQLESYPFDTGSVAKAPAEVLKRARTLG